MLNLQSPYLLPAFVHNTALDRTAKLADFPDFTNEETYNVGVETLNDTLNPGTTPFETPKYSDIEPYYENISNGATLTDIINQLVSNGLLTDPLLSLLNELNDIITNSTSPDELDSRVSAFVDRTQADPDLDDYSKMAACSCGNIAIASKNYWVNAHNDKENPWYPFMQDSDAVAGKKLAKKLGWFTKVLIVVGCDLGGGAVGAAAGSLLGPAGAVAGATVCGNGASTAAVKFLSK